MEKSSGPAPFVGQSKTARSGIGNGPVSSHTLVLVSGGGIGAFLFTVAYLIEGATRPGYDAWQQPVSSLSLGPGGWVQQGSFVVFGILMLLSAYGWYRFLMPGRAATWFPLFQVLSGLGLIGAGLFSLDPNPGYPPGAVLTAPTLHETLHDVFAYEIILTLACGCFILACRFAVEVRWRGWAVYSAVTGVLILIFFALFVLGGAPGGLFERVSTLSHALWLCLLTAVLLVRKAGRRGRTSAIISNSVE